MKFLKSFFLYAFILVGLCAATIIICGLSMILFKVEILGYKYISISENKKDLNYAVTSFDAIEISSNNLKVNLIPSKTDGITNHQVSVEYSSKSYGFVKKDQVEFSYSAKVQTKEFGFDEHPTSIRTLVISFSEPSGLLISEGVVNVFIPQNKIDIISVNSLKGNVEVYKTKEEKLSLDQLYVDTNKGSITVNESSISEMFLTSNSGKMTLSSAEGTEITSDVTLESNTSEIVLNNTLNGNVTLISDAKKIGPNLKAGVINGSLKADIKSGKIKASAVGKQTAKTKIDIKADSADIEVGTIYGNAYVARKEDSNFSINLKIGKLLTSGAILTTNSINTGKGNLSIAEIDSPLTAIATSGNISIDKISQVEPGIISLSGGEGSNISVTYDKSITMPQSSGLSVIIGSGNLTVKNIKTVVNLKVNSDRTGKIYLEFLKVVGSLGSPETFSIIDTNNHELEVKVNSAAIYRLLVAQPSNAKLKMEESGGSLGTNEDIVEGKLDYPEETRIYKILKRINYNESQYSQAGNLKIISSGGSVKINGFVPSI